MNKVCVRNEHGAVTPSFDILVRLPWGSVQTLVVDHDMTVRELKYLVEFESGLPPRVFYISYKTHHTLEDNVTLRQLLVTQGTQFRVSLLPEYGAVVLATVAGDRDGVMANLSRCKDEAKRSVIIGVAIYLSAHRGYHHILKRLLQMSGNPGFRTASLRTALHAACAKNNTACAECLLHHHADYTVKDIHGKTPLQVALDGNHFETQHRIKQQQDHRESPRVVRKSATRVDARSKSSPLCPISRLGRSVSPAIALQDLAIQFYEETSLDDIDDNSEDGCIIGEVRRTDPSERLELHGTDVGYVGLNSKSRPHTAPVSRIYPSTENRCTPRSHDSDRSEEPALSPQERAAGHGRRPRTAPPHRELQRGRATQEENDLAFRTWLRSKSQRARDERLVRRVSVMLDSAFGRDELEETAAEEDKPARKGLTFEDWLKEKRKCQRGTRKSGKH